MARNKDLEELLRGDLHEEAGITEKPMFGGRAWLLNGNLLCGARDDGIIARLGDREDTSLDHIPDLGPMISRGRVMRGWVRAGPSCYHDQRHRKKILTAALVFVRTLPAK